VRPRAQCQWVSRPGRADARTLPGPLSSSMKRLPASVGAARRRVAWRTTASDVRANMARATGKRHSTRSQEVQASVTITPNVWPRYSCSLYERWWSHKARASLPSTMTACQWGYQQREWHRDRHPLHVMSRPSHPPPPPPVTVTEAPLGGAEPMTLRLGGQWREATAVITSMLLCVRHRLDQDYRV
jgi:hypothetical protein